MFNPDQPFFFIERMPSTRSVGVNLARPFQGLVNANQNDRVALRRLKLEVVSIVTTPRGQADLIPALKRRAKFTATLRVEV